MQTKFKKLDKGLYRSHKENEGDYYYIQKIDSDFDGIIWNLCVGDIDQIRTALQTFDKKTDAVDYYRAYYTSDEVR